MTGLTDTGCRPQAHGQAEPGGGLCPRCGRPRCCATAKTRVGERCRKNPHPGATICTNHGLTAAGRAAAAERLQETAAEKVLAKIWNPEASPVTDAVSGLQRLTGRLEHAADALGSRLDVEDLDGPAALAWSRVLRELRQALEGMERLNLGQKAVEVEAGRVRLVAAAVGRVFEVLELPAEQRVRGTEVLLAELRAGSAVPGQVVEP